MSGRPYLRLVPKPIVKCGPAPYPATPSGFRVQRVDGGKSFWVTYSRNGRSTDVWVTRDELRDLARQIEEATR